VGVNPSRSALELARLPALMGLTSGSEDVSVALIDGPVARDHPDLAGANIHPVSGEASAACMYAGSSACAHGTFVAGILVARRGSPAPAICPDCTVLVRPVFREATTRDSLPAATPEELAQAIAECVDAGATILNLSAATGEPSTRAERSLVQSLDYAARRGVLVVAAAGNQGTIGSSAITRHPWVIPVAACSSSGQALRQSNLAGSIAKRGVGAPGEAIESLASTGGTLAISGTSFAAAFVTGTLALLWSKFPAAGAPELRHALTRRRPKRTVAPALLDAWAAHEFIARDSHRAEKEAA
jgi:subtilisin family serine protease